MKHTVLITGAGSGIGKDAAFALARRGFAVIATTHRQEQVEMLLQQATQENLSIQSFVLDITKEEDRKLVSEYEIDVLINNAAMGQTGPLAEVPIERMRENLEVNVISTFALTQLVLKKMIAKKAGRILFVSSLAGRSPLAFFGPYSMSKFALSAGAAMLREELETLHSPVQIALIEPGAYHTGFNQKMMKTKYEWLNEHSLFYPILSEIKKREERDFSAVEQSSTTSIVNTIVHALESAHMKVRYVAPWWQGWYVQWRRILGR